MTDLRYTFRQLHKFPGFGGNAVLILAPAIGANCSMNPFEALRYE